MEHGKMEGADIPLTLEQIEARRQAQRAILRQQYYAGDRSLIATSHLMEDVDREARRASDARVASVLASLTERRAQA